MTPITATQQFRAIAYLRWALFKNSLRRKGGKGELIALIIAYPFFAVLIITPTVAAFAITWASVSHQKYFVFVPMCWAIFALAIFTSVNISAPGLSFDPQSLIRFPITLSRYLAVRIGLGLLSVSNILATSALLGAATGATVARPSLAVIAYPVAIALALAIMFFVRSITAWTDRWMSTRRAREIFTGLFIFISIGIQWLNFNYNPGFSHGHTRNAAKIAAATRAYHHVEPFLAVLPPSLAGNAITRFALGQPLIAVALLGGVLAYAVLFLFIFATRMQREYRGENLSETPNQSAEPVVVAGAPGLAPETWVPTATQLHTPPSTQLVIRATLGKEWLYVRRNTTQLYGLLAPIAMVFIAVARFGNSFGSSPWLFPATVAYSTLGIAALAYNSLGLDGAGVQFYFLAPIRLGAVMLAKNLFTFGLNLVMILIIFAIITYNTGVPPFLTIVNTLSWVVLASLVNVTVGNRRSITAPKKIETNKLSRQQAGQLSALMSLGIVLGLIAFGFGLITLASFLRLPWLATPILMAAAALAFALYWTSLDSLDALALTHRETMIEALTKTS